MFVVRDWISVGSDDDSDDNDDFAYGIDGGSKYFNALFSDSFLTKTETLQIMRKYLENVLGKHITCCLLPHPGGAVFKPKSCSVVSLSNEFRRESFKLFQKTRNNCQQTIKTVQNQPCKCLDLCKVIKDYVFELGPQLDVPNQKSFLEKDITVKMSTGVKRFVEEFVSSSGKQQVWEGNVETIKKRLEKLKLNTKSKFRREADRFYSEKILHKWENELSRVLSQVIKNFMECIHVEKVYKKAIVEYSEWLKEECCCMSSVNFSFKAARDKRNSLLQEMKKNINQKVGSEEIFHQCQEYFMTRTDKIVANINDDVQSSSTKTISLLALGIVGVVAFLLATVGNVVTSAQPFSYGHNLGKSVTVFTAALIKKSQSVATAKVSASSQRFQQYKDGEMRVKLSFGTLHFKLEFQENM